MTNPDAPRRRKKKTRPPATKAPTRVAAAKRLRALESREADSGLDQALAMIRVNRNALLAAKARFETIERDSMDPGEQAAAGVALLETQRDLELLESRRAALVGGAAMLRPPTDADVAEAERVAGELARVISTNAKVAAVVGAVADVARLAEKLA